MTGELRALGLAHGLLLGLLLGSPMVAPGLLPWGVEALFIVSAFQVRLADRRQAMRWGWRNWTSHIRMMPERLIPWAAAATVTLIAGDAGRSLTILIAAFACEGLIYPLCAPWLARLSREHAGVVLVVTLLASAGATNDLVRYMLGFLSGISACVVWLRGPDSDVSAMVSAGLTTVAIAMAIWLLPPLTATGFPAAIVCATLTLAHMSVLRRRPLPWQTGGDAAIRTIRPLRFRLPSRPV